MTIGEIMRQELAEMLERYTDEQLRAAINAAAADPDDYPAGFRADLNRVLDMRRIKEIVT